MPRCMSGHVQVTLTMLRLLLPALKPASIASTHASLLPCNAACLAHQQYIDLQTWRQRRLRDFTSRACLFSPALPNRAAHSVTFHLCREDILSLAYTSPGVLASGDYGGMVILWNMQVPGPGLQCLPNACHPDDTDCADALICSMQADKHLQTQQQHQQLYATGCSS